jgi:two-component sensor histidine kinase
MMAERQAAKRDESTLNRLARRIKRNLDIIVSRKIISVSHFRNLPGTG